MGYYDSFTANLFRSTYDGRRVIIPFGRLGRTYLIPDERDAARITSTIQRYYQVSLWGIIGAQVFLGWRGGLFFGAIALIAFYVVMHATTRVLPPIELLPTDLIPISRRETSLRFGRALGKRQLYLMFTLSMLFVAVGVWVLLIKYEVSLVLATLFFGLCALVFAHQIFILRQADRADPL